MIIIQAIIAGFLLASALVSFSLAFAAVLTAGMGLHELVAAEFAKRRGDRT